MVLAASIHAGPTIELVPAIGGFIEGSNRQIQIRKQYT